MKTFQQFYEVASDNATKFNSSVTIARQNSAENTQAKLRQQKQVAADRIEQQKAEQEQRATDAEEARKEEKRNQLETQVQRLQRQLDKQQ
jgi:hypothetical protein